MATGLEQPGWSVEGSVLLYTPPWRGRHRQASEWHPPSPVPSLGHIPAQKWEYQEEEHSGRALGSAQLLAGWGPLPQGSAPVSCSPVCVSAHARAHDLCSTKQSLTPPPHPGLQEPLTQEAGAPLEGLHPKELPPFPVQTPQICPATPLNLPLLPGLCELNLRCQAKGAGTPTPAPKPPEPAPHLLPIALPSPPRLPPCQLIPSWSTSRSRRPSPGSQERLPAPQIPTPSLQGHRPASLPL